jgi:hypothetical protein
MVDSVRREAPAFRLSARLQYVNKNMEAGIYSVVFLPQMEKNYPFQFLFRFTGYSIIAARK